MTIQSGKTCPVPPSPTVNQNPSSPSRDGAETDRSEAERWLVSYLEDRGGSAPAREVRKTVLADGLEWKIVQRASQKVVEKTKSGFQGQWIWTLDLVKGDTKKQKTTGVSSAGIFGIFDENVTLLDAPSSHTM